jgi:hypothetical protein
MRLPHFALHHPRKSRLDDRRLGIAHPSHRTSELASSIMDFQALNMRICDAL